MSKFSRLTALSAVLLAPMLAMPVTAQNVEGQPKFTDSQRIGYLGFTSKSAMARDILNCLQNKTKARHVSSTADRLLMWHEILLDAIALDHTPNPDTGKVDFVQGGPARTARTLAMTQIAVYDAVNAFDRKFKPYDDIGSAPRRASRDAAIAYAAYGVLSKLYPPQIGRLTQLLSSDVSQMTDSPASIAAGRTVGEAAAAAIMARRSTDRSTDPEADFGKGGRVATGTTTYYGHQVNDGNGDTYNWSPDPLTPDGLPDNGYSQGMVGAYWGGVTPFVLAKGNQFRAPPPPVPGSAEYIAGVKSVTAIGASPDTPGSTSTAATRFIANYWGYDASPLLGTPPREYNQIAVQIALQEGMTKVDELARYLALVNVALGDAAIAAWDSKYYYNYWRPVTGVRRGDYHNGTGIPGIPSWKPVGVSVINTTVPIIATPPFPAYVSGHATFGAAMFEILRGFFPDNTRFTHVSDEYNGTGVDPFGTPRPLVPVRYKSFQAAQEENGVSRIYNGVHWNWDNIAGQNIGVSIGQYVPAHAFQRVRGDD